MTFTKLFSSITASTVWLEPSDTRVVWITMLAMADRHGRVWASVPGLAKEAVVSVESCREALSRFMAPDPDSRTKVADGRRLEAIDGGWKLINHAKYRAIRDQEERRAYKAEKQREYRSVDNVDKCGHSSSTVDRRGHNAEAEADTEAKIQKPSRAKRERKTKTDIADERHAAFKDALGKYWSAKNPGVEMPWDGREGKALGMFLSAAPHITLPQFTMFLRNRFKSEVNHGDRVSQWIAHIASYGAGPVDRFGKTIHAGETNGKDNRSPAKQRIDKNLIALGEAAIKRGWVTADDLAGAGGSQVPQSGHDGCPPGVHEGLRETGPEILPPER